MADPQSTEGDRSAAIANHEHRTHTRHPDPLDGWAGPDRGLDLVGADLSSLLAITDALVHGMTTAELVDAMVAEIVRRTL